ncbi:MAG: S9 family peptidase [Lewinella sp.]|nr:S9 family peptidase [Lewinella sp.]
MMLTAKPLFALRKGLLPLFFLLAGQLVAQAPVSLEALMSAGFPSNLVISPTSNRVAWVENKEGVRNIFTYVAGGEVRQLTDYTEDDGQALSELILTPGDGALLFVRGGAPNRRGEIPNPRTYAEPAKREIWRYDFAGDSLELIGAGAGMALSPDGGKLVFVRGGAVRERFLDSGLEVELFKVRGGAGELHWSPDGQRIAFVSSRGDHAFIGVFELETQQVRFLDPSVDQDHFPVWAPDSRRLAFVRIASEPGVWTLFLSHREGAPWSIRLADVTTGEVREVWKAPAGQGSVWRSVAVDQQLMWAADDQLVFPWEGDGWLHLYRLALGGDTPVCLTPGAFEVQHVSLAPDQRTVLYSGNQDDIDRRHIWEVGVNGGSPRQLTKGEGVEWLPRRTTASGDLYYLASTGTVPAHLASGSTSRPVHSASMAGYPSNRLVAPQEVVFAAADGMLIHGQLFLPPEGTGEEKKPALLFFHGGSRRQMLLGFHHLGYYHNAFAFNHYLAQQGYVVLSVNYRSGTGYGLQFREALNYGAGGASEFNDVLGAGLYLRQRPDVDPARIGLWGGSYGGFLTAMGLAKASDLFAAGVDLHGAHDWNVAINNFRPDYQPLEHPEMARLAFDSSPMAHLDGWRSPVLLIHGDDDRNVPFSETVTLAAELRRRGVYFEQLVFPDEVHGFLLHDNWMRAYRAAADFLARKL